MCLARAQPQGISRARGVNNSVYKKNDTNKKKAIILQPKTLIQTYIIQIMRQIVLKPP